MARTVVTGVDATISLVVTGSSKLTIERRFQLRAIAGVRAAGGVELMVEVRWQDQALELGSAVYLDPPSGLGNCGRKPPKPPQSRPHNCRTQAVRLKERKRTSVAWLEVRQGKMGRGLGEFRLVCADAGRRGEPRNKGHSSGMPVCSTRLDSGAAGEEQSRASRSAVGRGAAAAVRSNNHGAGADGPPVQQRPAPWTMFCRYDVVSPEKERKRKKRNAHKRVA